MAPWSLSRLLGRPLRKGAAAGGLDASEGHRRLRGFVAVRSHVNTLIQSSGGTVLARARYLRRNNGYAASAAETFASNVVGYGIKPSWTGADRAKKREIQKAFKAWTDAADFEGLTDFYGLEARVADELFTAGEVFVRRVPVIAEDGMPSLRLQLLPAEMLDPAYTLPSFGTAGGDIRQGIEFDAAGHRAAYHFWKQNPGDATQVTSGERERIPAADVLHILDGAEAGQLRGLPRLTPAIVKLWLLDVYDDAELERKKTAALFAGFVKRPGVDDGDIIGKAAQATSESGSSIPGVGTTALEPGTMQFLAEGEDVSFSEPADVGGSYEAFQYRTLLQACAGMGLPYAPVTGDVLRANYSNMRAAMVEFRRRLSRVQHGIVIFQLCRPVWRWWIEVEQLAGRLTLPGYALDRRPWLDVNWIPPRNEWVDPYKDRQAELLAVRAGASSLFKMIEAEGFDPEEHLEEIARANALVDVFGLVLDSDPRKVSRAGLTQARPENTVLPDPDIGGGRGDDEETQQ